MNYQEFSDREKLEVIEKHWYGEAQNFVMAPDPVAREEAYNRSDMLLDAWLEIAADLGKFSIQDTQELDCVEREH